MQRCNKFNAWLQDWPIKNYMYVCLSITHIICTIKRIKKISQYVLITVLPHCRSLPLISSASTSTIKVQQLYMQTDLQQHEDERGGANVDQCLGMSPSSRLQGHLGCPLQDEAVRIGEDPDEFDDVRVAEGHELVQLVAHVTVVASQLCGAVRKA